MRMVRGVATWVGGWLAAAAVIFAGLAVWTYAHGGVFHRVPVCPGPGPDMNVYAAAFAAGWLALIVLLAYWALGARSLRSRWLRLIGVTIVSVPVVFIALIGTFLWTPMCFARLPGP
jgi:hypothetical protein